MPERPGVAGRFVVGWDGVVRPALKVGPKADLESDVRTLAVALKKSRESPKFLRYRSTNVGTGTTTEHREAISPFFDDRGPATVVPRSPLTLCTLLRLGRADLAELLYAAATTWTPDNARPDLTDENISFPSLSGGWADTVYSRLIAAHCTADDAIALDAARRLDRFRQALEAKPGVRPAEPKTERQRRDQPAYVRNANVMAELLADQERRAKEAPRGPVPPPGGDPAARIAALIRDFDQIHVTQLFHNAGAEPGDGAIVNEIVAEGDPAVGPLLAALESDTRLTRCISSRSGQDQTRLVVRAVYKALQRLLKSERFIDDGSDYTALETAEGRKRLAAAARAFWEKNAAVPMVERWYRNLRDDSAGPARWIEASSGLIQAPGVPPSLTGYFTVRRPGQPKPGALRGEPLRKLRGPTVSELLTRRCQEMAGTGKALSSPDAKLLEACNLAPQVYLVGRGRVAAHNQGTHDDLSRTGARPTRVAVRRLRPLHRRIHDRPRAGR